MNVASDGIILDELHEGRPVRFVHKYGPLCPQAGRMQRYISSTCPVGKIMKFESSDKVDLLSAHSSVDLSKGSSAPLGRQPWSSVRPAQIFCQPSLSLLRATSSGILSRET